MSGRALSGRLGTGGIGRLAAWGALWMVPWLAAGRLWAQDPVEFFKKNCQSCHTIGGGDLTGPDLKDVTKRRERDWILRFLLDPKGMIDGGDAIATDLMARYKNVVMPNVPGMNRDLAEKLIDLIEKESALEKSQFAGVQISTRPFTAADRELGRRLFYGLQRLEARGPACITCHDVAGAPGFGGGHLGPDLTQVYARLGGRKPLSAWLVSPSTAVMQPVFKDKPLTADEILALAAFFEQRAGQTPPHRAGARVAFLLLGLVLAIGLMFAFDTIWKFRFRGVRRPLIDKRRSTQAA